MSHLFPERVYLVVLGGLVFLALHALIFEGGNLAAEGICLLSHFLSTLKDAVAQLLLRFDPLLRVFHLILEILGGRLQPFGFVNDFLDGTVAGLEHTNQLISFSADVGVFANNCIAFSNGRPNVGFSFFNLILKLLLELAELGTFEGGPATKGLY